MQKMRPFIFTPLHKKKMREYETLTHTFTKRIGGKNQNEKIDRRTQIKRRDKNKVHPKSLPIEILNKN